ncbi:hypothetical protein [Rhodobacter sp. 24-YEA-8]|uniref:hypothetical protein n=1 Tax=Rhodobacter sp. 24-YEA-8 TaxID=1884310 RepID=UPI00089ADD2D|nr:hypothetical protein [Rhodobacter sp. 24-YEA-8]SEB67830.1 hypothetical protein SAMN05519105_1070 [Rhodobacter sp. 24-YEA-8]
MDSNLWAEIKAAILAGSVMAAVIWGALGGATNALVIRVTAREALRHIALGATIAAGLGGLGAPLIGHWLGLPPDALGAGGGAAGGSVAYLTGSLGAAIFEVIIQRIRAGRLPRDNP